MKPPLFRPIVTRLPDVPILLIIREIIYGNRFSSHQGLYFLTKYQHMLITETVSISGASTLAHTHNCSYESNKIFTACSI